jgi:hypothetical protein
MSNFIQEQKAIVTANVATGGAVITTWLDIIPDLIGLTAIIAGVIITVLLGRARLKKIKIETEILEIELEDKINGDNQ